MDASDIIATLALLVSIAALGIGEWRYRKARQSELALTLFAKYVIDDEGSLKLSTRLTIDNLGHRPTTVTGLEFQDDMGVIMFEESHEEIGCLPIRIEPWGMWC